MKMFNDTNAQAKAILAGNDRGGYTVPTHGLYPFQWNWDSAFVAMGFATYDIDRALRELERLAEGQWDDGMIPQIVFHAPADSYFPGPEVWGTHHRIATSGITQPPAFAMALKFIADRAGAAFEPRIRALFAVADRYHRWFATARDPDGTGLVSTLHNWETGRDNSPEWDVPFARVPETTATIIRRRDTGHVDASMRPTDADYRRYIHLVDLYRSLDWSPAAMLEAAPFRVADIGTNAILLAADEALLELAPRFGASGSELDIRARISRLSHGLARLWNAERGWYLSQDLLAMEPIAVRTSAGLLALLTTVPGRAQVDQMASAVAAHLDAVTMGIASTLPGEPGFEPKRYWRGPVWAIVNWMIAEGLARHGHAALAERLRAMTVSTIETRGFGEYFDPTTGDALGGGAFSWTAAILLMLKAA
ncbi:MAG TPA: trehalase family glycosidase [Beijerinckiaceae bacterium]|nr:trehalase family glycosidase [Beijerinckiaceae bacterium]